jgi:phosphopantothenoylcysteine synthetase/decarboxylase
MNILVTAGNTLTPIDKVRGITNIFTGRTGGRIAVEAYQRGHQVTLLTSHRDAVELPNNKDRWNTRDFRTFDDLHIALKDCIQPGVFDTIIHCAAVSDYRSAGIYAPSDGTRFDSQSGQWEGDGTLVDRAAGKVKSDEDELWLRLVRTPKLIDFFRREWGFRGLLVKFKLEVGKSDEELLAIGERSRVQSSADLMVSNTLEGAHEWAFLGPVGGKYHRVGRGDLPERLMSEVERLHQERSHG